MEMIASCATARPGREVPAGDRAAVPLDAVSLSFPKSGLSPEMLNNLVEVLNAVRAPRTGSTSSAAAESDYQGARSAALRQDMQQVFGRLERAFTADPRYVARADSDSAFNLCRARIFAILGRLTATTRILAEDRIHRASTAIAKGQPHQVEEAAPEAGLLLALARSAAVANRYADVFVAARAAQLSHQVVEACLSQTTPALNVADQRARTYAPALIAQYVSGQGRPRRYGRTPLGALHRGFDRFRHAAATAFQSVWRRFPLLALFLVWFALGLVGGVASVILRILAPEVHRWESLNAAFSIWGMGFLVLVSVGFISSVRRSLR